MERLFINRSSETPEVLFEPKQGYFRIKGVSHPENPREFFEPIKRILITYLEQPSSNDLKVETHFRYINSASSKYVRDIFLLLNEFHSLNKSKIEITWYFDDEDIDMEEQGEDLLDELDIPFSIKAV